MGSPELRPSGLMISPGHEILGRLRGELGIVPSLIADNFHMMMRASPSTMEHILYTGDVTEGIYEAFGYDSVKGRLVGDLHDIGKGGDPFTGERGILQILDLPRGLTEPEKAVIRTHPTVSYDLLTACGLEEIGLVTVGHHEHQTNPYRRNLDIKPDGDIIYQRLINPNVIIEQQFNALADEITSVMIYRPYRMQESDPVKIRQLVLERFVPHGGFSEKDIDRAIDVGIRACQKAMRDRNNPSILQYYRSVHPQSVM